jgi:hypothetical protein
MVACSSIHCHVSKFMYALVVHITAICSVQCSIHSNKMKSIFIVTVEFALLNTIQLVWEERSFIA